MNAIKSAFLPIYGPLVVFTKVLEFIIWEVFSTRWKEPKRINNPVLYWQNEALATRRQLRETEKYYRRQNEEQQREFQQELKRMGRR